MADQNPLHPRAFVIGDPISHSRSPLIHRHWLETAGIKGSYDPVHIRESDLKRFVAALKDGTSSYAGGNVTLPHKQAIADLVDNIDETAKQIGAVNTVWLEAGRLCATNTDSHGFSANLDELEPGWDRGKTAVVFGAGGASRAILHALKARGFTSIRIVNRTLARAQELSDRFGGGVSAHSIDELDDVSSGANLFVNTTSLGMGGTPVPDIDFSRLATGALVTDIVYVPLVTPIMAMAASQGLATVDGLGMLLHQAAPGFEKWFGRTPAVTKSLRDLVIADIEAH
ncbi:shikimate 5-dehydrogenase [Hoeflea phototrophica DFL-43]|uniref:Shikimate dehydrogenase (NADP(+)) n=1 Tax=Hoeflea phototrophica (strain DSM 17068 / NCIMB 14078 / DFL-43) TaxID=411684 RepID=A9CUQ9_HOEPD|nr:shikimate dehydrogenase [Hoeflea phototrophica]EDQ35256.1 shikimate 5-dehydrogenase [Hoeflea phototrophica DFL-43]